MSRDSRIRVRVSNYNRIIRTITQNNNRIRRRYKHIFEDSLHGFIQVVKSELRKGFPERPASFNHLYTLDLYKNTKAESTITDTSGGYTVRIQVGYFISYGVHLEEFYPRDVPLKRLEDWIDRKEVKNVNARNLQRKLRVEPEVYPILDTTWNERAYSELYVEEALTRLRSVWFNA